MTRHIATRQGRFIAGIGASGLALTLGTAVNAQGQTDSAAGWTAISACATKPDETTRHTCVDDVLRAAGLLTSEKLDREKKSHFGIETVAPRKPVVAQTPATAAAKAPPAPDRVEVELAAVGTDPFGKLIITTTDGAVWHQIDGDPLWATPTKGQKVVIRKASMGSFLCVLPQKITYRCKRSR